MSLGYAGVQAAAAAAAAAKDKKGAASTAPSQFLQGSHLSCMALCEVVQDPSLAKHGNNIWVAPKEDHVVTRFLFVFCDGLGGTDVSSLSPAFEAEIRKALDEFGLK
jgi:hypothetical protein